MSPGTYKLKDAKRLLRANRYTIDDYATRCAWNDFGWSEDEVKAAFVKLNGERIIKGGHFYKTDDSETVPGRKMDFYKAENLNGERVYIHLYIEDDWLIIDSFKRLE